MTTELHSLIHELEDGGRWVTNRVPVQTSSIVLALGSAKIISTSTKQRLIDFLETV